LGHSVCYQKPIKCILTSAIIITLNPEPRIDLFLIIDSYISIHVLLCVWSRFDKLVIRASLAAEITTNWRVYLSREHSVNPFASNLVILIGFENLASFIWYSCSDVVYTAYWRELTDATTSRQFFVACTGFRWSSESTTSWPLSSTSRCAVKLHRIWSTTASWSRTPDVTSFLRLTPAFSLFREQTPSLATGVSQLRVRQFGTVYPPHCGNLTLNSDTLNDFQRHFCLARPMRISDIRSQCLS